MFSRIFSSYRNLLFVGALLGTLCSVQNLSAASKKNHHHRHHVESKKIQQFVEPVQINALGTSTITLTANVPVPFDLIELPINVKTKANKSVFQVREGGFFLIQAYGTLPSVVGGQTYVANLLINGKTYKSFENSYTPTGSGTISMGAFAIVYLRKNDKISFVLPQVPAGTTMTQRYFKIINCNNIVAAD